MYEIAFTKQALKVLRKLPSNDSKRIREKLKQLAQDPYADNANVTKLQNRPGYRLRVGDWRIIYDINDNELIILILKVGPRGGMYR